MLFHIIVRVRDGATFSSLRGCYALARAERKHSTVCESNYDHVVLARFSVWSSIFDFFLMLRRPRCFVTTAVLFLTEQLKKKIKGKEVRSQTVLLSGQ